MKHKITAATIEAARVAISNGYSVTKAAKLLGVGRHALSWTLQGHRKTLLPQSPRVIANELRQIANKLDIANP
jgi:hypothetical protein